MPSEKALRGPEQPVGLLRREGDYWTIAYDGTWLRLKDAKGLHYLEHLLRHPGRVFLVTELLAVVSHNGAHPRHSNVDGAASIERARKAVSNRIRQTIARISAVHGVLGRHLDNAVHTGIRCKYRPERPIRWDR